MRNPHQMIVDDIRKIIRRVAVGLNQNHIVEFRIFHGDVAVDDIRKRRRSLSRIVLPDDIWLSRIKVRLHLFF